MDQKLTWEQALKRALPIGTHIVLLKKGNQTCKAVVTISARGRTTLLPLPRPEDMYTCTYRVKGDALVPDGPTIVWAARSPGFLAQFQGEPVATIERSSEADPAGADAPLPIDTKGAGA